MTSRIPSVILMSICGGSLTFAGMSVVDQVGALSITVDGSTQNAELPPAGIRRIARL